MSTTATAATILDTLEARARRLIAVVATMPEARGFDGQKRRDDAIAEADAALNAWLEAQPNSTTTNVISEKQRA